ncbi:MAG TPA: glucose 1-dehydrogenase [Bacillota bacterium]
MQPNEFAGRVVLITGSAAGIGAGLARAFAGQGARVVVNSRKAERLEPIVAEIRAQGGEVLPITANVRDYEQVRAMIEQAVEHFGRLDVLINNAAGTFRTPAEQLTPNGWRAVIDTNLNGAFYCCHAAFPHLKASGGTIINISSVAGCVPSPSRAHYGASKAALNHLTETLAVEWGPHGIRVNAVAPGPILTEASSWADPAKAAERQRLVPLGRIGRVEDVIGACLFLASERAAYVNGAILRVDGGPLGLW